MLGLYNRFFSTFVFQSADSLNLLFSTVSFARMEKVYRKKNPILFGITDKLMYKTFIKIFTIVIILVNTGKKIMNNLGKM
jgi:hypothetical protein